MSHIVTILDNWMDYTSTSALINGPAACITADMAPAEMAGVMLKNHPGDSLTTVAGYLQDVVNNSNYWISPEFQDKIKKAIRIIQGEPDR